ncbi:MAG: oligoendopeptidase F [Anaerolineae bacterium SM23_ 63]|nr:MAG: oligoendopeptidase F [Anaerolineae bacterium SM23_ 63]HEY46062.1 oligoendopeptidase F [Anaerolineae bacterium]
MTETSLPTRDEIAPEHTWNAPSVFPSPEDWESEFNDVVASLPSLKALQGHLADGPSKLADALDVFDRITRRTGKVFIYAAMSHYVDTTDQEATERYSKVQGLYGQILAAMAFLDPELLSLGEEKLQGWIDSEPRLAIYTHYIGNLFRKQAHVRSPEVEELLGMVSDPFLGASTTARMLTDSDLQFEPATAQDGNLVPVSPVTLEKILAGPDREARRTAWENYADAHLTFKNTLASNLITSIKQNVFQMRARRHASTLEAALFDWNIPTDVFHNMIDTFRKHIPTWHRYWAIRRKAIGVDTLHTYDIWAPLTGERAHITFEQAVEWICDGLAPMGEDYTNIMRQGCLKDRWVDIYPNQGKSAGAFSYGAPGTLPFIMMSCNNDIYSFSTLAHELGHSMHSYLTWKHQPTVYCQYSLFLAEVASNFHQAMVRAHLLEREDDPNLHIQVIEEAMDNLHRYFFIMPTLARFELETHQRIERGEGLNADAMIEIMADLISEGYGSEMHLDRQRDGIMWATFSHLYRDYYVYQYATGISGAHALANGILAGKGDAVRAYLEFLKAGSSDYPLDILRGAGVDLTTPRAVEETFGVLAGLVDKLEDLVG